MLFEVLTLSDSLQTERLENAASRSVLAPCTKFALPRTATTVSALDSHTEERRLAVLFGQQRSLVYNKNNNGSPVSGSWAICRHHKHDGG